MPILGLRQVIEPLNGDNETDKIINGVHFNYAALQRFGYNLYSNNTISNESKCYLIFDKFKPSMLDNGTWVNATSCYTPYYSIGERGYLSIGFGALFGLTIMFTLMNLRKHGRLFLREDKRFRVVGRRWQWYWMLFVAACGMISTLTGVDIDRYYLQQIPIVLQGFFFVLMVPAALAMVWESTRHWGSWQERQIVDRDIYGLPQDDKRSRTEFYMPLVFYLFMWLNFFMTIPRSWTNIEKQNTPEQKNNLAKPAATGPREKAGAILAAVAWFVIIFSLHHSMKHYKPRTTGLWNRFNTWLHFCPTKLVLTISILGVRIAYGIASAWIWELSIFQDEVSLGPPFGLGYGTILLIIIIFEIAGFLEENEDKILIQQRRDRGQLHDSEIGIVKKPSWWSRNWADRYKSADERMKTMTTEVGGGRPTTRRLEQTIEMGNMSLRERSRDRPAHDPFRDQSPTESRKPSLVSPPRLPAARMDSDATSTRTNATRGTEMTGMTLTADNAASLQQPQRIRSMLDI